MASVRASPPASEAGGESSPPGLAQEPNPSTLLRRRLALPYLELEEPKVEEARVQELGVEEAEEAEGGWEAYIWGSAVLPDADEEEEEKEEDEEEEEEEFELGVRTAGLRNVGNTCFMNSSLQCLANVVGLRDLFLTDRYRESSDASSESSGETLAQAFAELLEELWSNRACAAGVRPQSFKALVGSLCDRFEGYGQQDAMEFVEFLLDGLREDCNRVKGPQPNAQRPAAAGRPNAEVALETVRSYLARSDSEVDDLFMGLFKSTTVCAWRDCGHESVVFDPFCSVKVPMSAGEPSTDVHITLTLVPAAGNVRRLTVQVSKLGCVRDLVAAVCARSGGLNEERCRLVEVYNHKVYTWFDPTDSLMEISDVDVLVLHELLPPPAVQSAAPPKPGRLLEPQDLVVVRTAFNSNSKNKAQLAKGLCGKVLKVDSSGDAYIKFDGIGASHWVFRRRQGYLRTALRASSEELREDPATGEFYKPSEYVDAFQEQYTCAEMRTYWREEMLFIARPPEEAEEEDDDEEEEDERKLGDRDVVLHFACRDEDDEVRELLGFPLLLRLPRSFSSQQLEGTVRAELSRHFGASSSTGCQLFRARDVRRLTRSRERLGGVDAAAERLLLVAEWEGSAPLAVEETLAEAEACGLVDEAEREVQLEQCLAWLTAWEQLDEGDAARCDHCQRKSRALRQLDLWSAPPVLVLQLKRFEYTGLERRRLPTPVRFPLEGLNLAPCLASEGAEFPSLRQLRTGGECGQPEPLYDLVAMSAHVGSAYWGHYVAYARSGEDGLWRLYDDNAVEEVLPEDVAEERAGAYLLFYLRRDQRPSAWGESAEC